MCSQLNICVAQGLVRSDLGRQLGRDHADARPFDRRGLQTDAADETALFFLGQLDLNHVWLQLGTLGRKTGWNEYYIVNTRMPFESSSRDDGGG